MIKYTFCPNCGHGIQEKEKFHFVCRSCGKEYFIDPAPCASVLPIKGDKVLLGIRAIDPYKGEYDLIGGFINPGESAEEAALREAKEETGLDMKILHYLGSYPDVYGPNGNYTLGFQFITEVVGGKIKADDDVAKLVWVEIGKLPKLNGFKNTGVTLRKLQKWYKENES